MAKNNKKGAHSGRQVKPTPSRPQPTRRASPTASRPSASRPKPDLPVTRRQTRSTAQPESLLPGIPSYNTTRSGRVQRRRAQSTPRSVSQPEDAVSRDASSKSRDTRGHPDTSIPSAVSKENPQILRSVESRSDEAAPSTSYSAGDSIVYTPDFSESYGQYIGDSALQAFYERIGYLPPLDDVTIDVLNFLSKSYVEMADLKDAGRISPHMRVPFERGLQKRNVKLLPDGSHDFEFRAKDDHSLWSPPLVPGDRKRYHEQLWKNDLEKCEGQSLEAIFQRTMMMSMIDRYSLFCGYAGAGEEPLLEFSVEVPWTCLPMPTHAAMQGAQFLACPKPDLAVGFRLWELLPEDCHWQAFPDSTKNLMCYDNREVQAFDFLTVEAKRSYKNVNDEVARNQCLNNASQALHNLYEFFKEADRERHEGVEVKGNKYRKIFFDRVRFFSVVAVPGSMKIRIHRACHAMGDKSFDPVHTQYPLRFVYSDYQVISGHNFTHSTVVDELTKIMVDYGVNELAVHLRAAIAEIDEKFIKYRDDKHYVIPRDLSFYSYGQGPPSKRRNTRSIASSRGNWSVSDAPRPVRETLVEERQPSIASDSTMQGGRRGPGRPPGSKGKKTDMAGAGGAELSNGSEDHQASPGRVVNMAQSLGISGLSVSPGASAAAEGQGRKRGPGRPPGSKSKKSRMA